jgi:2-keto-3-deoxy-6-phosphogluconate aldolase
MAALQVLPGGIERRHRRAQGFAGPFCRCAFCPTGGIDAAKAPAYLALPERRLRRRFVDGAGRCS